MTALVVWILCGVIAAIIGAKKGEGCLAFIAGILLGPSASWPPSLQKATGNSASFAGK